MSYYWTRNDNPSNQNCARSAPETSEWVSRPCRSLRNRAEFRRSSQRTFESEEGLHWLDYYEKLFAHQCEPSPIGTRVIDRLNEAGIKNVGDYVSHGIKGKKGDNWPHILKFFLSIYPNVSCPSEKLSKAEEIFHLGVIHHSLKKIRKVRDAALTEINNRGKPPRSYQIVGKSKPY